MWLLSVWVSSNDKDTELPGAHSLEPAWPTVNNTLTGMWAPVLLLKKEISHLLIKKKKMWLRQSDNQKKKMRRNWNKIWLCLLK